MRIEPFGFLQMFKSYVANSRPSEGWKKHAIITLNHWERFAGAKKLTLTFESITPDVLRSIEKFLINEKKLVKDSEGKKGKKAIRGMNTLHSIFALTRTF